MSRSKSPKNRSCRNSSDFLRRLPSWLVLSTALTLAPSGPAKGAVVYWDSDGDAGLNNVTGEGLGGSGSWNTTGPLWWDGVFSGDPGAGGDQAWVNGDAAIFTGTSGTVALAGPIQATGLAFNTSGYHVTGNTLTLTGTSPTIGVTSGVATISSVLAGSSGFTKEGEGLLILRGTNTFSGVTNITAGNVLAATAANSSAALGATTAGNGTVVAAGASLSLAPANGGASGINLADPITLNGNGFRNNGALRNLMGANTNTYSGTITLGSASRIQADQTGNLDITGPLAVDQNLMVGGPGFVFLKGVVSGSSPITHYGSGGLVLTNAANTYSGTITSLLGEVRAEAANAYNTVSAFDIRNGILQIVMPNNANNANNRLSDTAPISLSSGRIRLENTGFTGNPAFNYSETIGPVTVTGGASMIDMRAVGSSNTQELTLGDLIRDTAGSTVFFEVNSVGTGALQLGAGTHSRILNASNATTPIPHDDGIIGAWAHTRLTNGVGEFVKYGANGYTALAAADYAIDTAETGWAATQNVKLSGNGATLTGSRTINSLNMNSDTSRTLSGSGTLTVDSGGVMFSRSSSGAPTHTISTTALTAGPGAKNTYELFLHTANGGANIFANIIDNGANPVSLVKAGPNTISLFAANQYTGTTYINEGVLRDVIGANFTSLGSGNLNINGAGFNQSVFETDLNFTRALGTGVGQVQVTGGQGSGFSAFGRPIDLNFGGAGDTVTWGTASFNPGFFTLNGGNATHAVTLVNSLDLGGEQRYFRLDGNSSGGGRGAIGLVEGDITNGSIVKRGSGTMILEGAKSYQNGTIIQDGVMWLRGGATLGANVSGNDIQIGAGGALHIDSPTNIGDRQAIILQNGDNSTPAAIGFGAGYGDGSGINFTSFSATGGTLGTGGNSIHIANTQSGSARRVAVQLNGIESTGVDFIGKIAAVAPTVEAWFGASTANAVYTGASLTPSVGSFRLGSGGGTLTIQNGNVLSGGNNLIVGATDSTGRSNIGGVVYMPQAQNYSGTMTIGSGGVLVVGQNGALSTTAANAINLRGGEIRFTSAAGAYGTVDGQYAARNVDVSAGNSTLRVESLNGSSQSTIQLGTLRLDGSDRVFTVTSSTGRQDGVLFTGGVTLNNTSATNQYFDIGFDNQGFNSGILELAGVVSQTGSGDKILNKREGGTLILSANNTYGAAGANSTNLQEGLLVLTHLSAAGATGSNVVMGISSDRSANLHLRPAGALSGSTQTFDFNSLSFTGGNNNSTRTVTVGATAPGSENVDVHINSMSSSAVSGLTNYDLIFDGANGYRLTVDGGFTMGRDTNFRTRGALLTINGAVTGGFNVLKAEQGTLWLNGNNTYTGTTTINGGYVVAGHDNAFGNATSSIAMAGTASSQLLLSGARTLNRNIQITATGGTQTVGGLDAGAKTIAGNIQLSARGVSLSSITGGDVTITGNISGAFGVEKLGNGTVVLAPAGGTGNSYTGTTSVLQGTLIGKAQATSGSPFGTGAITVGDAVLQLDGLTAPTANSLTSVGALSVAGGARIVVNDTAADGRATEFRFASLTRTGAGTVAFVPQRGDWGGEERFSIASAPTLTNGIIGPWAVRTASGSDNTADYVTMSGSNVVTATYGGTGDLDLASGPTQVFDAGAAGGSLTGDRSVFAFRTNANVALNGFTLRVGDNAAAANGAGIILNAGADITGSGNSQINIGNTALAIYADDAGTSTLGVPVSNTRNNASNTLATVFTKFGAGTLEISSPQQFQGNIELNRGTLSLTAPNVIPTFENLNAVTGSVVVMSPGTSILLNNNDQEFGNIAALNTSNAFQFSAGTLNLGTATLTVGREGSSQSFDAQIIGESGSRLLKIGTGRLTLDNMNANKPGSLDVLDIAQGVVQTWLNDQSWATPTNVASAIPSTTTVRLRGGEWEAYAIGDSTSNQQRIAIGNNIIHQGGNSILDTNRPTGSGSNKLLTFGSLSLDKQLFQVAGGNAYIPRFDNLTTFTNHVRVQTDTQLVLAGGVSDGGNGYTLNKIGASDLTIGGDNSATWSGGTVITQGTIYLGSRGTDDIRTPGVTLAPSSTANLGSGDIVLNQGFTVASGLRLNAPSNVLTAQGQRVQIFGSDKAGTARIEIGMDAPLSAYGLRSTTDGGIALGIGDGGLYTQTLDQASMGNGKWGISAFTGSTYYMPATLGAGVDNVYRFMGSSSGTLGLVSTNVLTGTASVELGRRSLDIGNAPTNALSVVRTYGDQNYTGNTVVHRGADFGTVGNVLLFHGNLATPVIDIYGRLEARGDGRFTNDAGTQVNTVNIRPGGALRLDYNMDVNDQFVVSRLNNSNLGLETTENKWGDNTPILLDGGQLQLINSSGRVNAETVGQITVRGGAGIFLERNGTNGQIILTTNQGIARSGQATLAIRENATELGSINLQSMKMFINDATWRAEKTTNGILPVWMINASRQNFLGYDTATGLTNAAFSHTGTADSFLTGLSSSSIAQYTAGDAALGGTRNVYAIRVNHEASSNDTTWTGGQLNIHSGGLIIDNRDNARVNFDTTAVYFGNGTTPTEAIVYVDENTVRFGGVVTAAGFTQFGPATLQLSNPNNAITGNVQLNGGTLIADVPGALGTASTITLHSDYQNNNNGGQMPNLNLRTASASGIYNHNVVVAQNVPLARIDLNRSSGTGSGTITISGLEIEGTNGPAGTQLQIENQNSYSFAVSGATTIGGSSDVGIRVNTGTAQLTGNVTGAAQIIKTGDGTLRFDGNNANLTGGFTLNRGEWRLNGNLANVTGTGDATLNFGQVLFSSVGAATRFDALNQDLLVNGQMTFRSQRDSGTAGANITIGTNNGTNTLVTANSPYLIFQAASFGDDFYLENKVIVNDAPTFRVDSADLYLRDVVEGNGKVNKAGIYTLHFDNNAANTWTGGYDNFAGISIVRQPNATLGSGPVRVFAGSAISIPGVPNLGASGITDIYTSGTAFPVIGTRTIGNFNSVTAHIASKISGTGGGILGIDNAQTLSVDPLMATRDSGAFSNWYLGSSDGGGNLTANSVTPWGSSGTEFRLGGGNSTLTVNPGTAGAQFAGSNNRVIIGAAHTVMGYGTVAFGGNSNNTYGGGTLVSRARNLDGGYRAAILSLQGGNSAGTFRSPLGTGQVDVFGDVRIEGSSGSADASGTGNANTWVFHPGSRLRFDNATAYTGTNLDRRWDDATGITLNSTVLEMYGANSNNAANTETVGDLTIEGGSEISIRRRGTNWAELVTGNLTRSGSGTLQIVSWQDTSSSGGTLGVGGTASANRFIAANGSGLMNNGMVAPWIVSRTDNNFVKYDSTLGFQTITTGGAPTNYLGIVNAAATTLTGGGNVPANNGTEILSAGGTSNFTLGSNLDVYALRLERDINNSADNTANRITIRSGGLIQAANTPTINPDLYFGTSGNSEALIHASNNTLQINGKIFASQVTKFGSAFLSIRSGQPQFTGNWIVNGGGLQFLTPGAPSTGEVILNGARLNDNDTTFNLTEVRYNFNSGTPDLFTWGGGKITVNDMGIVRATTANDRLQQIPAVDLKTTGGGHEGIVFFQVDGARSTLRTGTLTLHGDAMISVDATSYGPGSTTGLQLGAGNGLGGLNNQGLYDVRLTGDGVLSLGDNSGSFTGNHTFGVGDASVRVMHDGAFGASTVTAHVRSTGALEIAKQNFNPTANLIQEPGSIERWAVDQARGSGDFTLGQGVHLQISADQTGTRTINLAGGSLMGYLPLDFDQVAVIQTLRSGVTVNLTANSFLGQPYPAGTSNGSNHFIYDMGKLNTTTNLNPNDPSLRGSYLQIDGNITGAGFDLTKVGQDMILLNGANSYRNTRVEDGVLQIGRTDSLPTTGVLTTAYSGMFDMNGYDQEVAALSGNGGQVNNSAFSNNTLTVNNAAESTYGGLVNGNVTLAKNGVARLILTGTNGYRGGTVLKGGTLAVSKDANLGFVPLNADADNLTLNGGALEATATFGLATNRGVTLLNNAGNAISAAATTTFTINSPIIGSGGFTKTGSGVLSLGGVNTYAGSTTISEGTLVIAGGAAVANTGAVVLANAAGAKLQLNDNETIGSLQGGGAVGGTVDLQGRVLTTGDANNTTFAGTVSGTGGSLVKQGSGKFTLAGENTYTGPTKVNAGTLEVAVGGSISGSTSVQVASGATFLANGAINSAVTVGGTFAGSGTVTGSVDVNAGATVTPGDGIGALTVNSNVSFAANSKLSLEIGGVGSLSDRLVANAVSLATTSSGVTLQLALANGYSPAGNEDIIFLAVQGSSSAPVMGTFSTFVDGSNAPLTIQQNRNFGTLYGGQTFGTTVTFSNGQEFAIVYDANFESSSFTGGNDVALMAVPEPNTAGILLGSVGMLLGLQRFRRRFI